MELTVASPIRWIKGDGCLGAKETKQEISDTSLMQRGGSANRFKKTDFLGRSASGGVYEAVFESRQQSRVTLCSFSDFLLKQNGLIVDLKQLGLQRCEKNINVKSISSNLWNNAQR